MKSNLSKFLEKTDKCIWIVGYGGSDNDGVVFDVIQGNKDDVKKYLASAAEDIRNESPEDFDFGTESIDEVQERECSLYAYVCFCDNHVDIEATPYNMLHVTAL